MKAKQTNEEISSLVKGFDISYGKAVSPFITWLFEQLKKIGNRTIKQIVDAGWKLFDLDQKIANSVVDNAISGAVLKAKSLDPDAVIDERALRGAINDVAWTSDQIDLRNRNKRASTSTRRYITNAIKVDFEYASDFEDNLKRINNHITRTGRVDPSFLRARVRKMSQDIRGLGFTKDYEAELKLLEKEIKNLSAMNYPTSETKKAYQRFIKGVRSQSVEAVEKSIEDMVRTKARYISRRIARTENARAQLDSFLAMSQDDDDIVGYKWRLDASHNITDICDVNAKADFGWGAGVYPKNKIPPIPAHPQCICFLTEVIIDDDNPLYLKDFDYSKGGNKLLKTLPTKQQNVILGSKARGVEFRKGKNWDKAIVNEPKVESIQSRFDKAIKSKFI
jgi:hypothetical protein